MKLIYIIIAISFPLSSISQTCVIAKKTKEAIYVAADSRATQTNYNNEGRSINKTNSVCKIYYSNKVGFAVIGAFFDDSINEALKACQSKVNIIDIISSYASSFTEVIRIKLDSIKKVNFFSYFEIITERKPFISQIIFFCVDSDSLFLAIGGFEVEDRIESEIKVKFNAYRASECCAGHVREIKDTVLNPTTWNGDIINTMNRLIKIEMSADPLTVGGDIDIIKVSHNKVEWIQRKKQCLQ